MIFMELWFRDVLCNIQRVCKEWRDIVEASTPIQQALFFKAIPARPVQWYQTRRLRSYAQRWADASDSTAHRIGLGHPLIFASSGYQSEERIEILQRGDASWRRQLATQPPASKIESSHYFRPSPTVTCVTGVGMDDLRRVLAWDELEDIEGWCRLKTSICTHSLSHIRRTTMANMQ